MELIFALSLEAPKKFLPQEPSYASKVTPDRLGEPLNSHLNTHRRSRAP